MTDMILNLVPDVATYRTALRTIRLWAKSEPLTGAVVIPLLTQTRKRDLRQRLWLPGRCCVGVDDCADMSAVSDRGTGNCRFEVLPHLLSMVSNLYAADECRLIGVGAGHNLSY